MEGQGQPIGIRGWHPGRPSGWEESPPASPEGEPSLANQSFLPGEAGVHLTSHQSGRSHVEPPPVEEQRNTFWRVGTWRTVPKSPPEGEDHGERRPQGESMRQGLWSGRRGCEKVRGGRITVWKIKPKCQWWGPMTRQQVWTKSRQGRRCQEGDGPWALPWWFSELIYQENSTCRNLKSFQIVTLCPQRKASGSGVCLGIRVRSQASLLAFFPVSRRPCGEMLCRQPETPSGKSSRQGPWPELEKSSFRRKPSGRVRATVRQRRHFS